VIEKFENLLNYFIEIMKNTDINIILNNFWTISCIIGVIIGALAGMIRKYIHFYEKKAIISLNKALKGYSVASKSEVKYQIKCYRAPRFKDGKTIKELISHIESYSKESSLSSAMFSIVGNPACGKTTTMRYLYCKLSKKQKCIYVQMQKITSMEDLSKCLEQQKLGNNLLDGTSVIAFFDGLDEAYTFFNNECADSMEKAFETIFFKDPEPKINEIFRKYKLDLTCVIVSFRPEFLERSIQSLTSLQRGNVYQKVYEISGMSDRDIIKIFKSLAVLKKYDAKLDKDEQRHQNRFPPIWQRYKYICLLRRILKENPNCIFQYPMYIRYAYAFMNEYLKRQTVGDKLTFSPNISVSFDILVNAIIKWEFHVYYGKSSKSGERELERLTEQMEQCAQDIAVQLQSTNAAELKREELKEIIQKYFYDDNSFLAIAHCFMVSNNKGEDERFAFCHNTFQDYFLAKHLFEKADYIYRKKCLCSGGNEYLRHMYYSILCQNEKLNKRISESVLLEDFEYVSEDLLTPESYILLNEKTVIKLKENLQISIAEIFRYIPYIFMFLYREVEFLQEEIESIIKTGELNLEKTGWSKLQYAEGVISPEQVISLNISMLPLTDIETLYRYRNMKSIFIRYSTNDNSIIEKIYTVLRNFELTEMHVYSKTGEQCNTIYKFFTVGELHVQKVYVLTPDYSQAHITMFDLNQIAKKNNLSIRFYLSACSNKNRAKEIYLKRIYEKSPRLLMAVFELETDEGGILSFRGKYMEGTLWNGINLARYNKYKNENYAYQVCKKLELSINLDSSELSYHFGDVYGGILFERFQYKLAKIWLFNSYQHKSDHLNCKGCMAALGLKLYQAWICSLENGSEEFGTKLEDMIMMFPDYKKQWIYIRILKLHCVRELAFWSKGCSPSPNIEGVLSNYKHAAYDDDMFDADYFKMIYANRREDFLLGEQILKNLEEQLKIIKENRGIEKSQNFAKKYQQQKLYYFLLKDEKKVVLSIINDLIDNLHQQDSKILKIRKYIYLFYQNEDVSIDRHLLWDRITF
jgi:hypothetical protein